MPITKDQKQLAMVGVLLVVMVLVFMNNFKPKKKKNAPPPAAPAVAVKPPAVQPAGQAKAGSGKSETGQKERAGALGWGRDPFVPYEEQETAGTGFTLNGVSIGKGKKGYAFINDEIVKAGDTFMGYEVVEIEKDKVLLRKDGQSFYIVFPQEE
jgi:type II secretory pathway component PulC